MLSYQSTHGKTHIVDETNVTHLQTLCGREISEERAEFIQESDRMPECRVCGSVLRRLKGPKPAPPAKQNPMPTANERDLLCPICHRPMKLAAKRMTFPTQRVGAVRVTMMLLCADEDAHQEKL